MTSSVLCRTVVIFLAMCAVHTSAAADDEPGPVDPADVQLGRPADFAVDVLPILRAKCLACHSASKKEGGLILESAELLRQGGDSGPAVVPEKPEESLLVRAAGRREDVSAMPPLPNDANAAAVTPRELGLLTNWIREGAKDSAQAANVMHWQSMPSGIHAVYSLALDPTGQLVAAGRANRILLYDVVRQREVSQLVDPALSIGEGSGPIAHHDIVSSLAFSPDGNWLASGGYRVVKLWQRADPLIQHRAVPAVRLITATADGRWLAAGLEDGRICLWERDGVPEGTVLDAHDTAVSAIAFAADGSRLLSASGSVVRLWEVTNGQRLGRLTTPSPVRACRFLPDSVHVATGHDDGKVRIWTLEQLAPAAEQTGEAIAPAKELQGHIGPVTSLAWITAEGPRLVSASEDGTLRQWDVEAAAETRQIAHGSPVMVLAATTDGTRLASAGADGVVRVWEAKGTKVAEMSGDPRPAAELVRRQDDLKVAQSRKSNAEKAVTDGENDLKERDESLNKAREQVAASEKAAGEAKSKVDAAQKKVDEAAASLSEMPEDEGRKKAKADADATLAKEQEALTRADDAVTSAKRGVELSEKSVAAVKADLGQRKQKRDQETEREQRASAAVAEARERAQPQPAAVRGLAFSPEGSLLTVGDDAGRLVQWHVDSRRAVDVFGTEGGAGITSLCAPSDGLLRAATNTGHVDTWRGERTWTLAGRLGPAEGDGENVSASSIVDRVLAIDFSPDGQRLALGSGVPSRSGQLQIWDLTTRTVAREFPDAHSDTVFDVAFSRDGTQLASGAADKFAKVFDVSTGELVRTFEGHTGHVLSVAWKADGSVLVTGGADDAIKAWTTETGEQQRTITSHRKPVMSVSFIGVEENIVSAAGDNVVLMHTVSNGRNYRRLDGSTDFLNAVVVNRDETRVIAGGEDGVVRIWDGTNGKLLASFGP